LATCEHGKTVVLAGNSKQSYISDVRSNVAQRSKSSIQAEMKRMIQYISKLFYSPTV